MKTLEVKIDPVENFAGAVDVTTIETTKARFLHVGELGAEVAWAKWTNRLKAGIFLVLATEAATELSKTIFPLVSSNLIPLNQYQILDQLSLYSETPLGIGLTAAVGAYYLGKSILKDRTWYHAVGAGLRRTQIGSVDLNLPTEDPSDDEEEPSK